MQNITLTKISGERYRPNSFKVYSVLRDGVTVGTIEQGFGKWEVITPNLERVSAHTMIKTALRVAKGAL